MTDAEKVNERIARNISRRFPNTGTLAKAVKDALTDKDTLYQSKIKDLEAKIARMEGVRDVWKIQMSDPSSKTDSYMRGMANGLELAMSILDGGREPNYIEKPKLDEVNREGN